MFYFDFDIVNFPFLDGDVPRRAAIGIINFEKPFLNFIVDTMN